MDIKQLDYFVKVCKEGSFAKAARKYFITPQGINAAIIRLEKDLGVKLFTRSNDGVTITHEGEYLYEKSLKILEIYYQCELYFDCKILENAPINISYVTEIIGALNTKACELISEKFPLSMRSGGAYTCEENILQGISTFALVNGPPFNKKLTYEYCFTQNRYLVANKRNPLVNKKNLFLKDLKYNKFIMVNQTFKTHDEFHDLCQNSGFEPNILFYTDTLSTTYSLLKSHVELIGMSFDFHLEQNNDAEIVCLPIVDLNWPWDIYIAYNQENALNDTQKDFLKKFLGCFKFKDSYYHE